MELNAVELNGVELNAFECLFLETEEREKKVRQCVSVVWVFIIFRIENAHTHNHTLYPKPFSSCTNLGEH